MALDSVDLTRQIPQRHVVPVGDMNDWKAICYVPKTADTANLLIPSSITRTGQKSAKMLGGGTGFRARARYTTGTPITVNPVVQFVGIDANGVPQLLSDDDGATSFTLTYALSTDLKDAAGCSYTTPTNLIDARNCATVQCLVVTAMTGGGTEDSTGAAATCPAIMLQSE